MVTHFTVRMAWHDNKWDGNICRNPDSNFYCNGSRSLLSDRIARRRNDEKELASIGQKMDNLLPEYMPPCYWTTAAFSSASHKIIHEHPFPQYEKSKKIKQTLKPYSVFSWPFRLSFNHSPKKRNEQGNYPRDLTERIRRFISRFQPRESIVFFYLNYDNRISGDREKYALVGCAVLSARPEIPPDYDFTDAELESVRSSSPKMKNFPRMNWAIQVTYDFEKTGVRLPYHEYLEYISEHPDESEKLEEIKVLIEEPSLIFGFKYVMADIDEDQCIFLLTKLRKAIDIVQEHGIVNFDREQKLVSQLLEKAWKRRGLYPGLPNVLNLILEDDSGKGEQIVRQLQTNLRPDEDLCEKTFAILQGKGRKPPLYLEEFGDELHELRKNLVQHTAIINLLKKLSLFSLKRGQLKNIAFQNRDSFAGNVSSAQIAENPYLLPEEYRYETIQEDLDNETMEDGPLDLFRIDIGMFPEKYLRPNSRLQDLAAAGPERLRAIIIEYLYSAGAEGHCYSVLEDVYESIQEYPLFYKRELTLNKDQLLASPHKEHFEKRLHICANEGRTYFYLNEVKRAEEIVRNLVTTLINRHDHAGDFPNIEAFVKTQAKELKNKGIKDFDERQFIQERTRLLQNVLKRSFYVISGKPGTGKTKALQQIIGELENRHEQVTALAPTGKASIRLKIESGAKNAQTIDRFIYSDKNGYWKILEKFSLILEEGRKQPLIENLIVDESSMVDLQKLSTLFSMIRLEGEQRVKRVILVGDEKQLPPIGFGKPYHDIIEYLRVNPKYFERNYVKLLTNCRQELDPKILEFADIFSGKNRYYDELLSSIVNSEGDISTGLAVERWTNIRELQQKIKGRLEKLFQTEINKADLSNCKNSSEMLNVLLGLYPNGFVRKGRINELGLDNFQLLSPYRAEAFGSMGISRFIKSQYPRGHWADPVFGTPFNHAEKIIRLSNEYVYNRTLGRVSLRLSNGSIGIINNKQDDYRAYYFTDLDQVIYPEHRRRTLKEDEEFELAYAITVHKAQGSDFRNVFLVIPNKLPLLSQELVYTALTRSKRSMTIFLQKTEGDRNVLEYAKTNSAVLQRRTSIFEKPENASEIFEPEKGIGVKSKIEYILFKELKASGLKFEYEFPLDLEKGPKQIKPDFTIDVNGQTYYWEHLGELDIREYWSKWIARRDWYRSNGKLNDLITTDDLGGVRHEIISRIIQDIKRGKPQTTEDNQFSRHHYRLYGS